MYVSSRVSGRSSSTIDMPGVEVECSIFTTTSVISEMFVLAVFHTCWRPNSIYWYVRYAVYDAGSALSPSSSYMILNQDVWSVVAENGVEYCCFVDLCVFV